jgi:hypothetical protein
MSPQIRHMISAASMWAGRADLEQARHVLAEMGVELTPQQMKRAADKDAHGRRKLPFFIDPIEGTLKIEKDALINSYMKRQVEAERNLS